MSTDGTAPDPQWKLPDAGPRSVLVTVVVLLALAWGVLAPGAGPRLTPEDVEGAWPFADRQVDVLCSLDGPVVDLDGVRYALPPAAADRPELPTLDPAVSDQVWLREPGGGKVPLDGVRVAAASRCEQG